MSDRATARGYLSDDVQQRVAVAKTKSVPDTPLPLAKMPGQARERPSVLTEPMLVQTQPDEEGDAGETVHRSGTQPSLQQIADRVYQLMRQDLRLERERKGW